MSVPASFNYISTSLQTQRRFPLCECEYDCCCLHPCRCCCRDFFLLIFRAFRVCVYAIGHLSTKTRNKHINLSQKIVIFARISNEFVCMTVYQSCSSIFLVCYARFIVVLLIVCWSGLLAWTHILSSAPEYFHLCFWAFLHVSLPHLLSLDCLFLHQIAHINQFYRRALDNAGTHAHLRIVQCVIVSKLNIQIESHRITE